MMADVTMSKDEVWSVVHGERLALADDLDDLTDDQWATPSWCDGWDVHDVLAHLINDAKTAGVWGLMREMALARFDFDRMNARAVARERRDRPADTLAAYRAVASRTTGPPVAIASRLVEAFVHAEDIRRPLGLTRDYPPAAVAEAIGYQARTSVKVGGSRERVDGLALIATDAERRFGDGEQVCGSAIDLLMAISNRPVDPDELSGPGASILAERVAS